MQSGKAVGASNMSPRETALSRRAFLGAAGGALAGITARCHLYQSSAAFPADVVYYPCNVRWERNNVTELVRFEHCRSSTYIT
jgi:hypothetical protein